MTNFADNRKARYDYETLEEFDAGLVLTGQEVKSIRAGGANFAGCYLSFKDKELWINHLKVSPYAKASRLGEYDPTQPRKVLMRKQELVSLFGKIQQKGLTLIPISLYPRGRHIKLKFGLCRGKKAHDKRDSIKKRDLDREMRRHLDE